MEFVDTWRQQWHSDDEDREDEDQEEDLDLSESASRSSEDQSDGLDDWGIPSLSDTIQAFAEVLKIANPELLAVVLSWSREGELFVRLETRTPTAKTEPPTSASPSRRADESPGEYLDHTIDPYFVD